MSEKDLFGVPIIGLDTIESQVLNYIEHEFVIPFKNELAQRPEYEDPLTSRIYRKWDRTLMIRFGRVDGGARIAQVAKLITPEQFAKIQTEAMGTMARIMGVVDMGNRPPGQR